MPRYKEEFKEQIVRKMMPPNSQSIAQINRETGVSTPTLYNWRDLFRQRGNAVPADSSNPEHWRGANKLAVIIETAALNEEELSVYCRKKGLYAEQISRWKDSAIQATEAHQRLSVSEKRELQQERKKNRMLEKELRRKEKALAETAALLVLKKKLNLFGGTKRTNDQLFG